MTRAAPLLVALMLLPDARADGKCDTGRWAIALDAERSDLSNDSSPDSWSDAVLIDATTLSIDLHGDGEVDIVAVDSASASVPTLGLLTACDRVECGDPLYAPAWRISDASRPELIGGELTVEGEFVRVSFVGAAGPVDVVWRVGDWLPE